ncbi:hypothetical protein F511_32856 [Dorcoceras hygrometricum]|uniref:Uncharacterized protein n=1 Tax=Dorcoceras hygrometricum TaxID=472368 RepID=A0A2Z7ADA1_9LAMI|nr:hypothetical protein F511_32856 [Dorcoceras hygrometricum]
MRRVVNYHSSWARQQQVEVCMHLGCFSGLPFLQLVPGSDQYHKETGTSRTPVQNDRFAPQQREITISPLLTFRKSHSPKSSSHAQNIELSITDSACKNKLVVVSLQYGPFNPYIPIRSTTIGKSRVAKDPIAMRTSWRSNSDIASVTSIGYPRISASGESSTTMHRLLHASGSHPIPPPNDPKLSDGFGSGPTGPGPTDEHSVHPHHRDFIVTLIADQIGRIDSVSKTEYYDLKNYFLEPQCKMTVLPLNSGKS